MSLCLSTLLKNLPKTVGQVNGCRTTNVKDGLHNLCSWDKEKLLLLSERLTPKSKWHFKKKNTNATIPPDAGCSCSL